jgi:flagellar motor switch protein FliN/FliY
MPGLHRVQTDLDKVWVNVSVVLGQTIMPIHKLLRMGRGAVIELLSNESDMVDIMANGQVFAQGQVIVSGSRIQVEITELLRRPRVVRERGMANPPEPEPEPLAA